MLINKNILVLRVLYLIMVISILMLNVALYKDVFMHIVSTTVSILLVFNGFWLLVKYFKENWLR